jgi:hypothetical protein
VLRDQLREREEHDKKLMGKRKRSRPRSEAKALRIYGELPFWTGRESKRCRFGLDIDRNTSKYR